VATPTTPGNTALLSAVGASSASDAWAVGRTQVNKSSLTPLAVQWNGTAWSVSSSFPGPGVFRERRAGPRLSAGVEQVEHGPLDRTLDGQRALRDLATPPRAGKRGASAV
jgi:hypothetical protein